MERSKSKERKEYRSEWNRTQVKKIKERRCIKGRIEKKRREGKRKCIKL